MGDGLDPQLLSRARGALLGLVAGNQLAAPTQHLGTPEAIRQAFPDGVWDLSPSPPGSPYDDDAALALMLAESLVERRGFDADDVARRWVRWMERDGRGLGTLMRRALTLVDQHVEPFEAGRRALRDEPQGAAGSGSVTRCIPVALRYHDDVDRLIRVSHQQAAITHADERSSWGAVAANLAARELLHGNIYFVEEVVHQLQDKAPRELLEALHRVPRERQEDLPVRAGQPAGYVVHCVEIAFWFATHDRSVEDALVYLAQAGGDSGGNATLTGALLGARYGDAGIPPQWIGKIAGLKGVTRLADGLVQQSIERGARTTLS